MHVYLNSRNGNMLACTLLFQLMHLGDNSMSMYKSFFSYTLSLFNLRNESMLCQFLYVFNQFLVDVRLLVGFHCFCFLFKLPYFLDRHYLITVWLLIGDLCLLSLIYKMGYRFTFPYLKTSEPDLFWNLGLVWNTESVCILH